MALSRTIRTSLAALGALGALGFVFLAAPPAGAATAESIRSYAVVMTVRPDGTLHVREQISYDFGSEQRHGIQRKIPTAVHYDNTYDRIYRLTQVRVSSPDGAPTQTKVSGGSETRIRVGDPNRTVSGPHTYVIDYDVAGALNKFSDHEELYWNAIGDEWPVGIAAASAVVETPTTITKVACFGGSRLSTLPCGSAVHDGPRATFRQAALPAFEGLTVVVGIPPGSVPAKPILKERFSAPRAFAATPITVGGLGVILALAGAGVGLLLWTRGRDRRYVGQVLGLAPAAGQADVQEHRPLFTKPDGAVEFAPPDGIRPGQIGTLIDEKADPLDVTATIIDLAVRKYLFIEELPRSGWFSGRDWRLSKVEHPGEDDLLPYERKLYDSLFLGRDTVCMSELKNTFAASMKSVQDRLYIDVVKRGWFARRPDEVRSTWSTAGVFLIAAAAGITYLLAKYTHLALLGIGLIIGAAVLWRCARFLPARTAKGSAVLARVLGFRQYIRTAEAEQLKFEERESIFSRYLPYAIVFGETERWAKAFESLAANPAQGNGVYWYSGPAAWNLAYLGASMNGFTSSAVTTMASTPSGSGSSGFGGGGFSGGGGGGGGGGSW